MLSRLNAKICFAFDKDVTQKELEEKVTTLEKDLDYQLEFESMALNNNMYQNY
jgi:hypothetical protein